MPADVFEWLESSAPAVYIRQSTLLFPVIEIIHITGFIGLVGSALLFDLRLLGLSKRLPVTGLASHLLPWSRRSLWLVIPAGILLFVSQAKALSTNAVFGMKLILIVIAFSNAGFFHFYTFRSVSSWNVGVSAPVAAKVAALISIIAWCGVITCGRLIAYF
jgi:hypothetical protein